MAPMAAVQAAARVVAWVSLGRTLQSASASAATEGDVHTRGRAGRPVASLGLAHGLAATALDPLRHLAPDASADSSLRGAAAPSHLAAEPAALADGAALGADLSRLERRLSEREALAGDLASEVKALQGGVARLAASSAEDAAELREARDRQLKQAQASAALAKKGSPQPHTVALAGQASQENSPCSCEPSSATWKKCTRTAPKCIWIDLGAADGNSFKSFLGNYFGPVANCPSGQWEAMLVEANPRFDQDLSQVASEWPGSMHMYSSTAAYMCKASTSFYLDTVTHANNYWGSSISPNAVDVKASGLQKVTVPTLNLNQILYEMTIPGDWVMVKMDIEGAEWDILPCLALAPAAANIDRLFVEIHNQSMGSTGTDQATMEAAQALLRLRGVDIPAYFSNTL